MLQKESDCIALPKEKNAICHVQSPARSKRMYRWMPSTELSIHNKQRGCRDMHPTHCFQLEFIHSKSALWTHTNYGYRRAFIPGLWTSEVHRHSNRQRSRYVTQRVNTLEHSLSNLRPEEKVQVLPISTWRCSENFAPHKFQRNTHCAYRKLTRIAWKVC